eukprot:EG_transcript_22448
MGAAVVNSRKDIHLGVILPGRSGSVGRPPSCPRRSCGQASPLLLGGLHPEAPPQLQPLLVLPEPLHGLRRQPRPALRQLQFLRRLHADGPLSLSLPPNLCQIVQGLPVQILRQGHLFSGAAVAFTLRADELPQAEGHPRQADGAQTAATPEAQGQGGPLGKRNIKT